MARKSETPWRVVLTGSLLAATVAFGTVTAEEGDCCSCTTHGRETLANRQLPCLFDHPAAWDASVGDDGALVSAVVGPPPCGASCSNGAPGVSVSFGKKPDANAGAMEEVWKQVMPIVGSARCGDATVTFYSPPGSDDTGFIGGVKFFVGVGGRKYSGAATFTCGQAGGWLSLRDQFIESFRGNPDSNFGER
jgi:hypothetical protein